MIGYVRDKVVVENRAVNFKIVWMFLEKFIQLFNSSGNGVNKGST